MSHTSHLELNIRSRLQKSLIPPPKGPSSMANTVYSCSLCAGTELSVDTMAPIDIYLTVEASHPQVDQYVINII